VNFIRLSLFSTIFATSSKPTKFHISTIDTDILTGERVPKGNYKGRRKEGPTHEGKKGRGEERAYLEGRREHEKGGNGICVWVYVCTYIHCVSKKQDTKLLPITFPNVNRFSKFFH